MIRKVKKIANKIIWKKKSTKKDGGKREKTEKGKWQMNEL